MWVIKTVQWDGFGDLEPLGARDLAGTLSKLRICEDPCRDEEGRLYVIQSLQETSNSKTIDHKRRPESRLRLLPPLFIQCSVSFSVRTSQELSLGSMHGLCQPDSILERPSV